MKRVTLVRSLFAVALLVASSLGFFQAEPAQALQCGPKPACIFDRITQAEPCVACCMYACSWGTFLGPCQVVC